MIDVWIPSFERLVPFRSILPVCILSVLLTLTAACSKSSPVTAQPKNPREYTWTIDTLRDAINLQTVMLDIWGSSASDVYVAGFSSSGEDQMWRFDGNKWSDIKLSHLQGGAIRGAFDLRAVVGFGPYNVWAVGRRRYTNPVPPYDPADSSLVIHGSGQVWQDQNASYSGALAAIAGDTPLNIWASGDHGLVLYYDGNKWSRDSVTLGIGPTESRSFYSLAVHGSEVNVLGSVRAPGSARTTYYLLSRNHGNWTTIDSMVVESGITQIKFGMYGVWRSPQGTLYTYGPHIFQRAGPSWIKTCEKSIALEGMFGTSETSIFVVGHFGTVLHYNGSDWYEYSQLKESSLVLTSGWTDGTEVFIVGYLSGGSKSLVLHGR